MKSALRELVTGVPFNDIGIYFRNKGTPLPDECGGNCIELGERLVKTLLTEGRAEEADLIDIEGEDVHAGVLAKSKGEKHLLDPGFMMLKPICISRIPIEKTGQAPALPILGGKPSSIRVTRLTKDRIQVVRTVDVKPRKASITINFDTSRTRKDKPVSDPYGVREEVLNLLFRFHLSDCELRVRKSTTTGDLDCIRVGFDGTPERYSLEGTIDAEWDRLLEEAERKFRLPRNDIFKYLEGGLDLYREINS